MNPPRCRLLIADDQPHILETLDLLLRPEGYQLVTAHNPNEVLLLLGESACDGLLIHLNYTRDTTSGQEGLDLISAIRAREAHLPTIVMTAWASVDLAVDAMRRGASDFIQKPWDNPRRLSAIRTQLELHSLTRRAAPRSREPHPPRRRRPRLHRRSPPMRPLLDLMAQVGPSDVNILSPANKAQAKRSSLKSSPPLYLRKPLVIRSQHWYFARRHL